jgi:hypothetical protein
MHLYRILFFYFFAIKVYSFVFGLFQKIIFSFERVGLIAEHFFALFVKLLHASLFLLTSHKDIAEIVYKGFHFFVVFQIISIFSQYGSFENYGFYEKLN